MNKGDLTMKIYNHSNQIQELCVRDRENPNAKYSIYIMAKKELELDNNLWITNLRTLTERGLIRVIGTQIVTPVKETVDIIGEEKSAESDAISAEVKEDITEDNNVTDQIDNCGVVTEDTTESIPVTEESSTDASVANTEDFVCKICGKEFASARSLSMHMTKSHESN